MKGGANMNNTHAIPVQALEWELTVLGMDHTDENLRRVRRAREVQVRPIGAVWSNVPVNPLNRRKLPPKQQSKETPQWNS